MAVIDIFCVIGECFRYCVRKHECSAGWCIQLLIMMFFDNFHIIVLSEHRCGFTKQIHHQIDADGHIARTEDREFCRCCTDILQLFRRVSSGADDNRRMMLLAVGEQVLRTGCIGKIDNDVAFAFEFKRIGINRKIGLLFSVDIKAGDSLHLLFLPHNVGDNAAHPAVTAGKCNFQHLFKTPFKCLFRSCSQPPPVPYGSERYVLRSARPEADAAHRHSSRGSPLLS